MPLRTKVSGFSIVKNGVRLGYPFKESLLSLAPLCDELVVALGDGDDTTGEVLEQLRSQLACPLVIIHSPWNKNNIQGGSELANQTNIALSHCKNELCFYIQCDEVLHEDDYELLRQDFIRLQNNTRAQALVLQWVHFYGNFHTYVHSRKWYRREIRVIKKSSGLKSFSDAQGFRIWNEENKKWTKPLSIESKARIFHYGWVRPPKTMAIKSEELDRLWHGNARDGLHNENNVYPLHHGMKKFLLTHPKVMKERIELWGDFDPFVNKKIKKNFAYWKYLLSTFLEMTTGWRPGEFKNYKLLK